MGQWVITQRPRGLRLLNEPQETCGCLISEVFKRQETMVKKREMNSHCWGKAREVGSPIMLVLDGGAQISIS